LLSLTKHFYQSRLLLGEAAHPKNQKKMSLLCCFSPLLFAGQVSVSQLHEEILYSFQAHGQTRLGSAHQESQQDVQISPRNPEAAHSSASHNAESKD